MSKPARTRVRSSKKAKPVSAAVKHALFSLYLHCELHEQAKRLHPSTQNGDAAAHRKSLKKYKVLPLATAVATLKKARTPEHLVKFAIMMLARAMPHHGLKHARVLARKLPRAQEAKGATLQSARLQSAKANGAKANGAMHSAKAKSAKFQSAASGARSIDKVLESFGGDSRGVDREERLHRVRESLAGAPLDRYELSQSSAREEQGRPHVQ
jgi:hypothetical protein